MYKDTLGRPIKVGDTVVYSSPTLTGKLSISEVIALCSPKSYKPCVRVRCRSLLVWCQDTLLINNEMESLKEHYPELVL